MMTVAKEFVYQNKRSEGCQVEPHLLGKKLTVESLNRPRYKLADLLAEMPEGLPRVEGWEEMFPVGVESIYRCACKIAATNDNEPVTTEFKLDLLFGLPQCASHQVSASDSQPTPSCGMR